MKTKTHLVWFRNDLRTIDNPALASACEDKQALVIAVFIATPEQWRQHHMSPRQAAFIYDNLLELQHALAELNIPLIYTQCQDFKESVSTIQTICLEYSVNTLFYNHQYEVNEQQRDIAVKQAISAQVECIGFDGHLFTAPLSIRNGQRKMYQVFTPFSKAFLQLFLQKQPTISPKPLPRQTSITNTPIPPFDYPMQPYKELVAGEHAALTQLTSFCKKQVAYYKQVRDIPSIDGTSKLSAYLAIGVISVRQCLQRLIIEHPFFWQYTDSGAFCWFNELVWREFYNHVLVAFPQLSKSEPYIPWTKHITWQNNTAHFDCWKQGKTGFPIVDAAMRQLNQTGWMHNRLRMIVASFLVKDLLIDWHWGEQYFISQLVDGDLAANNGGWQWAASTGMDAAPYFRIFNPTTQGERFDPNGEFIKYWLPELSNVPASFIHTPHQWADKTATFIDYPRPIINHKKAREQTLIAFTEAKNKVV